MPTVKATFTADISQFRTSLAQATTVVTGFDRTVGQVNRDLARFGNQFSGATIARQAETMAKAIEQVGGVTRLTDSEVKRANATIQEAISKYRALGTQAPADVQRLAKELQNATTQTRSFGESIKASLGSFVSGIGVGVGLSVFNSISQGLKDIAADGAKLGPIRQGFDAMQGGALQADATLRRMRASTRGLVDDLALMTAANRGVLLGLTDMGIDMAEVARVATILGRAVGQDATKSTDDLTVALARQSPMILDNLGIKLNLTEANERYAESLGKSVSQLTDEEKKLAFATAAMEAAREKAKALGDQSLTTSEQIQRIATSLRNVGAEAVNSVNSWDVLSGTLGKIADQFDTVRRAIVLLSTAPGAALRVAMRGVAEDMEALAGFLPGGNSAQNQVLSGFIPQGGPLGQTLAGLMSVGNPASAALRTMATSLKQFAAGDGQRDLDAVINELLRDSNPAGVRVGGGAAGGSSGGGVKGDTDDIKKLREELEKVLSTQRLLNAARRGPSGIGELAKELAEARDRSLDLGPKFASTTVKIEAALAKLVNSPAYREFFQKGLTNPSVGVNRGLGDLFGATGISGASQPVLNPFPSSFNQFSGLGGGIGNLFSTKTVAGGITVDLTRGLKASTDFTKSLQSMAQAFARLGQIAGPSLDGVTRGFGSIIGAADTSREVVSALSKSLGGLMDEDGKQTTGGKALSGGLAGLTIGTQLGGLLTNRAGGFAAGAAGGAATGALAGGWIGAGVGALVGGLAGMFASAANAAARRAAKDISAQQLEAQFGGLENLLGTVGRLGLSQQSFLERFYGDPKAFGQAVSELNAALERERQIAEKLSKALQAAAAAGGVLAQTDFRNLATLRRGGPGDEAAGEFLTGQTQSLISGLEQMLQSGALSPAGVSGAGIALGSAFALLREQGVSVVDALRTLEPAMQAFQDAAVLAGKGSTAEFDALKSLLDTLNSESLGPFVQGALGAGQALAALANTGMITQDAFGGLSSAIAEAYYALERDGRGGVDAVRLLQGPLQNVWQLMQDFGLQTDEGTQRLIDFALEAGLIGEQMRPAADRMAAALDRLIERMDALLARFAELAGVSFPNVPDGPTNYQAPDGTTVQVPGAARGAVVTRPTLLMAGEREAEAVIPLSRLRGLLGGGGGGGTVVVPVSIDGQEIARVSARYTPDYLRVRA